MAKVDKPTLEKFVPVLFLVSIALAFLVGILWQKVSNLEGGKTTTTTTTQPVANQPPAAGTGETKLNDLEGIAKNIGVDVDKYKTCVAEKKVEAKINNQASGGGAAGVQGTPGSFIVNGKGDILSVPGAYPYDQVKVAVDIALGKSTAALPTGITKLTADLASALPKVSNDDHFRGNRNAKVTVIEYSDFQCPFCQRFHPTMTQLMSEYGNDVGWVYRHYTLDQIHPLARPAAISSECIFEQKGDDGFWKFTDEVLGA